MYFVATGLVSNLVYKYFADYWRYKELDHVQVSFIVGAAILLVGLWLLFVVLLLWAIMRDGKGFLACMEWAAKKDFQTSNVAEVMSYSKPFVALFGIVLIFGMPDVVSSVIDGSYKRLESYSVFLLVSIAALIFIFLLVVAGIKYSFVEAAKEDMKKMNDENQNTNINF